MAQYQQVRIGEISRKYKDALSERQLHDVIQEIKLQFESQLGFRVFDYAENGLPIDIVYVSESQKKKRLKRYQDDLATLGKKIEQLEIKIQEEKSFIETNQEVLHAEADTLNQSIEQLNQYVKKANQSVKSLSKKEYDAIRQTIEKEQSKIEQSTRAFNEKQARFQREVRSYKRMVNSYNTRIHKYNALIIRMETLSNSIVEVKGKAFGKDVTSVKTYYEDGKKMIQKTSYSEMEKIEIYGFDGNIDQLKAVLAHEIGHLVGVGHVDKNRALMNPMLQPNQIDKLELTQEDIKAFNQAFR